MVDFAVGAVLVVDLVVDAVAVVCEVVVVGVVSLIYASLACVF